MKGYLPSFWKYAASELTKASETEKTDEVGFSSSQIDSLDCREGHMKKNSLCVCVCVCVFVCVRVKGHFNRNSQL